MNVSLTPELEKFVTEEVKSGKYSSAEEVIREGLRLLREHEEQNGTIRKETPAPGQAANGGPLKTQAQLASVSAEKEWRWLAEHQEEYRGQWVALSEDQLIAHGNDAREVYLTAQRAGVKIPSLIHIPSEPELPFGGW